MAADPFSVKHCVLLLQRHLDHCAKCEKDRDEAEMAFIRREVTNSTANEANVRYNASRIMLSEFLVNNATEILKALRQAQGAQDILDRIN